MGTTGRQHDVGAVDAQIGADRGGPRPDHERFRSHCQLVVLDVEDQLLEDLSARLDAHLDIVEVLPAPDRGSVDMEPERVAARERARDGAVDARRGGGLSQRGGGHEERQGEHRERGRGAAAGVPRALRLHPCIFDRPASGRKAGREAQR